MTGRRIFCVNSAGASFPITCCITSPSCRKLTSTPGSTLSTGAKTGPGLERWQRGQTGLPDRRCRHARTVANRLHAQSGAHDRRLVSDQKHAGSLARRRKNGSGIAWSTPISPATAPAGNGVPVPAPTRRPTSAYSTRYCRAKNSIRTATISCATAPNSPDCRKSCATSRGWLVNAELAAAGIEWGVDYPEPMLDLKTTRESARWRVSRRWPKPLPFRRCAPCSGSSPWPFACRTGNRFQLLFASALLITLLTQLGTSGGSGECRGVFRWRCCTSGWRSSRR